MNYFKNILNSIYIKFWLKWTKDGKEYAKKYKDKRIKELTELIKSKGDA